MMQTAFSRAPSVVHPKTTITTRRPSIKVSALRPTGVTVDDVKKADGGRMVVEVEGQKVLLAAVGDEVFAVSNKCSHMGISLVGSCLRWGKCLARIEFSLALHRHSCRITCISHMRHTPSCC
jgi:nitrite reductase/ring-hydroxylating ferredoxin subunit